MEPKTIGLVMINNASVHWNSVIKVSKALENGNHNFTIDEAACCVLVGKGSIDTYVRMDDPDPLNFPSDALIAQLMLAFG